MSISKLAAEIHEKTGMEGKELEAFTFLAAAVFADLAGEKKVGDYFEARMNQSWKEK